METMVSNNTQTGETRDLIRGRLWRRLLLFGFWTLPGLIFASLIHARMLQVGEESHFWQWLGSQQSGWYMWALLTPVITWLGRRYRLDRTQRLRSLAIHVAAVLVLGSIEAIRIFGSTIAHGEPLTFDYLMTEAGKSLRGRERRSNPVIWHGAPSGNGACQCGGAGYISAEASDQQAVTPAVKLCVSATILK